MRFALLDHAKASVYHVSLAGEREWPVLLSRILIRTRAFHILTTELTHFCCATQESIPASNQGALDNFHGSHQWMESLDFQEIVSHRVDCLRIPEDELGK